MKYLVLIGDGMADYPLDEWGGQTPLEYARTPAMDAIAESGIVAEFCPIPEGFPPGSDIGNLSLFGYDPHTEFTGRAPLEAINQDIALGPSQIAFRCNLVSLSNGTMSDFTSGHISNEDASELIGYLNERFDRDDVQLHAGVSYRHLAIMNGSDGSLAELEALRCTPPHDITDQVIAEHLPKGAAATTVRELMAESQRLLPEHPVNQRRVRAGDAPANSIWLWGQGRSPSLASYEARFGISGGVISAVDLINGIGRAAGLEVIRVPGATGYLDTDYEGKVAAALSALERVDFVYLHVEAPDETSHEGRADKKNQALEDFDSRVVGPCLAYAENRDDCRVFVAPDHITAISTKTHAGGPVPFAMCGPEIEPNGERAYNEVTARASGVCVNSGFRLIPHFITADTITEATLQGLNDTE